VTTANPPENIDTAAIGDVRLGSRLYLAIRWVLYLHTPCFIPTDSIIDLLGHRPPRLAASRRNARSAKSGGGSAGWNTRDLARRMPITLRDSSLYMKFGSILEI
jgi:hypothetical protein